METNTGGNSNAIYWQLNPISRTASVRVPRIIHRDGFILGREDTEKGNRGILAFFDHDEFNVIGEIRQVEQ